MNDRRVFLGTVAGWGFLLNKFLGVPAWAAYSAPALVLNAGSEEDSPPALRQLADVLTAPTRSLIAADTAANGCGCSECGPDCDCSSCRKKYGQGGPAPWADEANVIDVEFTTGGAS